MTLFILILITCLAIAWVGHPLVQRRAVQVGQGLDAERMHSLYRSLRELGSGKKRMAEDDYSNIERRLILEIAKTYHAQGIDPDAVEQSCLICGNGLEPSDEFCDQCGHKGGPRKTAVNPEAVTSVEAPIDGCGGCGKPIDLQFKFCPHCGVEAQG